MSILKILKIVLHELVCFQRKFLWGYTEEKNRIAWLSWEKVCKGRNEGGLGVLDIECWNTALLGKWWDRFGKEEHSIWKKVIVDKFYGGGTVWDVKEVQTRNLSTLWRNIVSLRDERDRGAWMSREGFHWKLGMGDKIKFWKDKWVRTKILNNSFLRLLNLASNRNAKVMKVGHFSNGSWMWKNIWRRKLFGKEKNDEQRLKEILTSGIMLSSQLDQRSWSLYAANGYTISKAYSMMARQSRIMESRTCKRLWNKLIPTKVSCFGWRLLLNGLPTKSSLQKRGILLEEEESICSVCRRNVEDENHLFVQCSKIQDLWMRCYKWWGISIFLPNSISLLCEAHSQGIKKLVKADVWFFIFLVVTWSIWYTRNNIIHNSQQWDEDKILDLIQRRSFAWIRGNSVNTIFSFFSWCNFPSLCVQEITKS
ncbi:hypothetical protein SLA2020_325060 [Shorea laevis]